MRINLLDMFDVTVETKKKEIAIEHNDETITFEQLRERAFSVANYLLKKMDVLINKPIAVFLPKEINTVISDIGILYSGNPFMNLDIKTPMERIFNILDTIKPQVILTNQKYIHLFGQANIRVIDIENIEVDTETSLIDKQRARLIDTDPMCIINTSGSTGTPKGVVLSHRSFFDFTDWAVEEFMFDGTEIIGSLSPVVFDIFDFELCMLITKGSRLILLDGALAMFPANLLKEIAKRKVSFIFWVPSIMVNIANLDLLGKIALPDIKMIWFAGEVFPTKQFLYWYDHITDAVFVNLYGPIEITLDCTYHVIHERPDENLPLPIGVPCKNTDILILNEKNQLCCENEEGELCVRGSSLAMGYYNNTQKTLESFTQNPLNSAYPELIYRTGDMVTKDLNGLLHFKGRKDSLIKHMGYRIELGEIEHVIVNDLKIVNYCCAVYDNSNKKIVLFYEMDKEIAPKEFRKQLMEYFPSYMLPNSFERMDMLPRNANGKIDRLQLKTRVERGN
jgi:amino acid adenylation domain-containing protein